MRFLHKCGQCYRRRRCATIAGVNFSAYRRSLRIAQRRTECGHEDILPSDTHVGEMQERLRDVSTGRIVDGLAPSKDA